MRQNETNDEMNDEMKEEMNDKMNDKTNDETDKETDKESEEEMNKETKEETKEESEEESAEDSSAADFPKSSQQLPGSQKSTAKMPGKTKLANTQSRSKGGKKAPSKKLPPGTTLDDPVKGTFKKIQDILKKFGEYNSTALSSPELYGVQDNEVLYKHLCLDSWVLHDHENIEWVKIPFRFPIWKQEKEKAMEDKHKDYDQKEPLLWHDSEELFKIIKAVQHAAQDSSSKLFLQVFHFNKQPR
ncbi:hypothetical protein BS47DRAFT_1358772 [Hydnum rufescens UP504]|uniref:Uncharacterized protein n=1 Tax=Hydnum rufescens UP504 TaxID=1448309 RepID=A0A9P6B6T7_9AGAM|nr:hypothetical protein BS47DRAFT_1358772 [Hydnum rufescens UP504]